MKTSTVRSLIVVVLFALTGSTAVALDNCGPSSFGGCVGGYPDSTPCDGGGICRINPYHPQGDIFQCACIDPSDPNPTWPGQPTPPPSTNPNACTSSDAACNGAPVGVACSVGGRLGACAATAWPGGSPTCECAFDDPRPSRCTCSEGQNGTTCGYYLQLSNGHRTLETFTYGNQCIGDPLPAYAGHAAAKAACEAAAQNRWECR